MIKPVTAAILMTCLAAGGMIGCSDTEQPSKKSELKITTPSGTTTVTTKQESK